MISNILIEYMVPMRDGVKLYTLVQLPEEGKKYPIVFKRNPYADTPPAMEPFRTENTHGYAIVYQECRGTGRSEGDCIPYINERNDGLDTLEWIRKQDFYDGEIYLEGQSYLCTVHLSYLKTNQPDVKAACLMIQDSNRYNIMYRNGFYKTGFHGAWAVNMYKKKTFKKKNFADNTMRTLPLAGISKTIFGEISDYIENEIAHPDPADPFWSTREGGSDYSHAVRDSNVPVLLATGFFDLYTEGIFDMWNELSDSRRNECAMIVTPYDHGWSGINHRNSKYFPGSQMKEVCPDWVYVWFDHIRKGTPLNFIRKGEIAYYSLFENQWRYEPHLTNGEHEVKFYLNSSKELSLTQGEKGEITYLYNPYAPAKFEGGCSQCSDGMKEQPPPDSRYDIISFLTAPFENDTVIKGIGNLKLHVRSTAPDTCFYARLSLVREDVTLCLRDCIDSLCRTNPNYLPGMEMVLDLDMAEISFQVKKGEQLRLDVSSSCDPHYHVHTNRKGPMSEQTGADSAYNTIVTGSSFMTLFALS